MVTWIPSIYPLYVSIYTSTMDPMGYGRYPISMDIVNGYSLILLMDIFMDILIMKYMGYYTWILDINVFISC